MTTSKTIVAAASLVVGLAAAGIGGYSALVKRPPATASVSSAPPPRTVTPDWPSYTATIDGRSSTFEFGLREPIYFDAKEQGREGIHHYVLAPNTLQEAKAIERTWGWMCFDLDQKLQESEYRHVTARDRLELLVSMDVCRPQRVITGPVLEIYRLEGSKRDRGERVDPMTLDAGIIDEVGNVRRYELQPRLKEMDNILEHDPRREWFGAKDPAKGRHAPNSGYGVLQTTPLPRRRGLPR